MHDMQKNSPAPGSKQGGIEPRLPPNGMTTDDNHFLDIQRSHDSWVSGPLREATSVKKRSGHMTHYQQRK